MKLVMYIGNRSSITVNAINYDAGVPTGIRDADYHRLMSDNRYVNDFVEYRDGQNTASNVRDILISMPNDSSLVMSAMAVVKEVHKWFPKNRLVLEINKGLRCLVKGLPYVDIQPNRVLNQSGNYYRQFNLNIDGRKLKQLTGYHQSFNWESIMMIENNLFETTTLKIEKIENNRQKSKPVLLFNEYTGFGFELKKLSEKIDCIVYNKEHNDDENKFSEQVNSILSAEYFITDRECGLGYIAGYHSVKAFMPIVNDSLGQKRMVSELGLKSNYQANANSEPEMQLKKIFEAFQIDQFEINNTIEETQIKNEVDTDDERRDETVRGYNDSEPTADESESSIDESQRNKKRRNRRK